MLGISALLLVYYFSRVLIPKYKNGKFIFALFGGLFFLLEYVIFHVPVELIRNAPVSNIIVMSCIMILSVLFFKGSLYLHVYLISSFFAVRQVSAFVSENINVMAREMYMHHQMNRYSAGLAQWPDISQQLTAFSNFLFGVWIITFTLMFFYVLHSINKRFAYTGRLLSRTELLYLLFPCLSALGITLGSPAVFMIAGYVTVDTVVSAALVILSGVFLLFSMIYTIQLFQKLVKSYSTEKEQAILKNHMHQLQSQINDTNNMYTSIQGMRHDLKGHLTNIALLVQPVMHGNKQAELDEYIGKLESTVNELDFVYQTGNSVSDIIIHQKHLEAKNKNITFDADFIYPAHHNIGAYDIAVILNNGLENAIEAGNSIENSYIRLRGYVRGEMFYIEIENTFARGNILLDARSQLPLSNKPDNGLHGFGLSNIRRCARAYLGDLDFCITQGENYNVFTLIVMLQGKVSKSNVKNFTP
jgi:hypothetical protein